MTFARPPPDIPLHGSARIRIHKPVRHVMLPEQGRGKGKETSSKGKVRNASKKRGASESDEESEEEDMEEDEVESELSDMDE